MIVKALAHVTPFMESHLTVTRLRIPPRKHNTEKYLNTSRKLISSKKTWESTKILAQRKFSHLLIVVCPLSILASVLCFEFHALVNTRHQVTVIGQIRILFIWIFWGFIRKHDFFLSLSLSEMNSMQWQMSGLHWSQLVLEPLQSAATRWCCVRSKSDRKLVDLSWSL